MLKVAAGIIHGRDTYLAETVASLDNQVNAVYIWNNTPALDLPGCLHHNLGLGENFGGGRAGYELLREAEGYGYDALVLSNDDVICLPGYVEAAVKILEEHPRVAYVSTPSTNLGPFPMIQEDSDGIVNSQGCVEGYVLEMASVAPVIRLKAAKEVGFWPTWYFLHSVETDFCWRLWASGWKVWQLKDEYLKHHEGQQGADILKGDKQAIIQQDTWRLFRQWRTLPLARWMEIKKVAPFLYKYVFVKHHLCSHYGIRPEEA